MKKILLPLLISPFLSLAAHAGDSTWLLCNNGKLALNSFEHRAGAGSRATDLTLLFGGFRFVGTLDDTNAAKVFLTGEGEDVNDFEGSVRVDYAKNQVELNGALQLAGQLYPVTSILRCKNMSGKL